MYDDHLINPPTLWWRRNLYQVEGYAYREIRLSNFGRAFL